MFPWKLRLLEPSQNRSKSGLSKGMSERASRGFGTVPVVARHSCGVERGSPPSGRGVKEPDLEF